MASLELDALRAWRKFADSLQVNWSGDVRSWKDHISKDGYVDEERLVQPVAFPAFARQLLGYEPTEIAAEEGGAEGKPDFTPADLVTHPFIFETKSTRELTDLAGHNEQVSRYLWGAADRINYVVLTNLVGLKIYERSPNGKIHLHYQIDLRGLLKGDEKTAATTGEARRLANFIRDFGKKHLSRTEKLHLIRVAPKWNQLIEATSSSWVLSRLEGVVDILKADVRSSVSSGSLTDSSLTTGAERLAATAEISELASRIGSTKGSQSLADYVKSDVHTLEGKALLQYETHVAYYVATRLLLVRIWEDLGLLEEILRDGGFNQWMERYDGIVADVVRHSFDRASKRYRSLFVRHQDYSWYTPSEEAYAEALYQLANTYLGAIESDILGEVYERLLERIDRKLLGQYYTPRDVIALIWSLMGEDEIFTEAEDEGRVPKILDIATGSGGFLVHAATKSRKRLEELQRQGSQLTAQTLLNQVSDSFIGIEVQRFSAHLAELNMLVQLGRVVATDKNLKLPPLGIVTGDTLALHDQENDACDGDCIADGITVEDEDSVARARSIASGAFEADVACGNPPYIGQKIAAQLIDSTRRRHRYWEQYVGHHMDYLYWFLITGVSKLRDGGRFGFITTEYWLRATGAKPLRKYLAENATIDRLVLLRNFRPFKDAPGQHTLIVTGRRLEVKGNSKPRVSRYEASRLEPGARGYLLSALRRGASSYGVNTFAAPVSPNALGEEPWSEVILPRAQYERRRSMRAKTKPLNLDPEQGVLSSANRMRSGYHAFLTNNALQEIGGDSSKHGVFLLTDEEYRSLGNLSAAEQELAKVFVNTADVLPYAAVLPLKPNRLLYLAAPDDANANTPFPVEIPNVRRHLERFRGLLESKVAQYGEERPWWSLHRPRGKIVSRPSRDGRWADYAVTPNWGGGGRLTVGLPPAHSVPAQGLNALLAPLEVPGAYVAGILNSSAIQEMAETLPPGYLRRADFMELGVPMVGDIVDAVAHQAIEAADSVEKMVGLGERFPDLISSLQSNLSLPGFTGEAWSCGAIPQTRASTVGAVNWLSIVGRHAIGNHRIEAVQVVRDLLGLTVQCSGPEGSGASLTVGVKDEGAVEAVASSLRGAASRNIKLKDIAKLPISISSDEMVRHLDDDRSELSGVLSAYRAARDEIDSLVDPYV